MRRERIPRLEFLPAATPAAEAALLLAGFQTEDRLPLMTCTAAQLRAPAPPPDVLLQIATADAALHEAATVQNAARGRGVAAALTASLGGAAFARGIPADAHGLRGRAGRYTRAGFMPASEIAFMSLTP